MTKKAKTKASNVKTSKLKVIAPDKKKHIAVNFIGVLSISILFNVVSALIIMMGISVSKEIYDKYKKNPTGFSFADLSADMAGMIIAVAVYVILVSWVI